MTFSLVIFLAMLHASCGFYPNRLTEFQLTSDTYTHEDITEIGILKAVAAYFEDYPRNGSTISLGDLTNMVNISAQRLFTKYYEGDMRGEKLQNVISRIVTNNNDVYKDFFKQAVWHFNGEKIKEANELMITIRDNIIVALNREDDSSDDYALKLIGQFLHIMQMFYSNTNWVEMFGSDAYYSLGIRGRPIFAQAPPKTVTCRSCGDLVGTDCNDTLLVGDMVLTSGYLSRQDVVKPYLDPRRNTTGKCSHGGPSDETGATVAALGGINKDTVLPDLSPHYYLHHQAAQAAINHTTFFFNDKDYGLRKIIGEEKFRRFVPIKSGQSLPFVVDYSGSMRDDIAAVKTEIIRIINSFVGTNREPSDYIIVLFNDPENLMRTFQTESSQKALEYVANINVYGGGDCPEYSLSGIEKALTLSKPDTKMFIFTDAPAKDSYKASFVLNLALTKNIELKFVLRISCVSRKRRDTNSQARSGMLRSKRSTNGEDLYRSLAAATGGSVYVTTKAGISKLANIITEIGTRSTVTIFKREITPGSGDINFNVDNTISVLIIEITGKSLPNEEIYNQMGILVTSGMNITDLGIGKIIKIKVPSPGVWRLSGLDSASWLVDVSAISVLDISTIFVKYDPSTRFEYQIKGRPVAGEEATMIVTVPSANLITSLDFISLLSDDGSVLAQYSNMTRIDSRADTSLFRAKFELPIEAFKVSVSGRDTDGNPFTRLQPKTIAPVAIQLDLLPINNSFYINETLTVECTVTNKGDAQSSITVTVEDDKGFAQEPRTHSVSLDPDQSERKQFTFKAGSSPGVVTTVTITAKAGSTGEQFVVTRLATKERVFRAEDNSIPVCTVTSMTGSCDESMVDPCVCSQYNWTATAEIWDEGFGLYQITSSVKEFSHGSFPQGYTRDKGTVMASVSGNCCKPNAYITVVDVASNTGQCTLKLAPDVETIPTECIEDLMHPVCNITSMTGICDETMVDPCVCSQYNWTATAEIWDEGLGLKQITSPMKEFSHDIFPQGYTREKGIVTANVFGNCCNPSGNIMVVDLASNTGKCIINLAPDVENIPTECIQDLIDPVCNITSMTGICNETMVDPCDCQDYEWEATAAIWDEGFGLSNVSSSVKDKARFVHEPFEQGHNAGDGPLIAKVGGTCCRPSASITVTDLSGNMGQCNFNLAPDVEVTDQDCIPSTNSEDDELGQKGNAVTVIVAVAASAGLAVIGIVLVVICIVCKSRSSK